MTPLAEEGFDRLYATARALGEETRFGIYRTLCLSGEPVPVRSLAQAFSLHPNAIRQHLGRLEQAGLVVSRLDRPSGSAGRPRRLYEPSPDPVDFSHPPRLLRALVGVLAETVEALPSRSRALLEFGRRWGRSWADRRKRENGPAPRSRRGRLELVSRELRDWGWQPTTSRENGTVQVSTGRCLFEDLVPASIGRCCELEEGLLTGIVESLAGGRPRVVQGDQGHLEVLF